MRKPGLFLLLLCTLLAACEPFTLPRKDFPTCASPSARIGYRAVGLEVEFFLTEPQGDIGAVGWNLGDGRNRTGTRFTHVYERPGTYTVSIVLANQCNNQFTTSQPITVTN